MATSLQNIMTLRKSHLICSTVYTDANNLHGLALLMRSPIGFEFFEQTGIWPTQHFVSFTGIFRSGFRVPKTITRPL